MGLREEMDELKRMHEEHQKLFEQRQKELHRLMQQDELSQQEFNKTFENIVSKRNQNWAKISKL